MSRHGKIEEARKALALSVMYFEDNKPLAHKAMVDALRHTLQLLESMLDEDEDVHAAAVEAPVRAGGDDPPRGPIPSDLGASEWGLRKRDARRENSSPFIATHGGPEEY